MDIPERGIIRMDEGILLENKNLRMGDGDRKENGESEIKTKEQRGLPQTMSNRDATSTTDDHVFPSCIGQDVVVPTTYWTTPPSHSTISQ